MNWHNFTDTNQNTGVFLVQFGKYYFSVALLYLKLTWGDEKDKKKTENHNKAKVPFERQLQIYWRSDLRCSEICRDIFSRSVPSLCRDKKLIKIKRTNYLKTCLFLVVGFFVAWRYFLCICGGLQKVKSEFRNLSRAHSQPVMTDKAYCLTISSSISVGFIWLWTNIIKHMKQTPPYSKQTGQNPSTAVVPLCLVQHLGKPGHICI